ncbi:MAG: hypothetical protein J5486_05170 [Bacteroidaceae bacterium]|nr:hypothetical protein [Bacteroidaceae bacterium]
MKHMINQWLMVAVVAFWTQSALTAAQAQPAVATDSDKPTMVLVNIYGDRTEVPLTGGMRLYWPQTQLLAQPSTDYYDGVINTSYTGGFLVVADKNGQPIYSCPTAELAFISFRDLPGQLYFKSEGLMGYDNLSNLTYDQYGSWPKTGQLTWRINGKDYEIVNPGEVQFSDDLRLVTIISNRRTFGADGSELQQVVLQDTLKGASCYLARYADEAKAYMAAYNASSYSSSTLNQYTRDFYAQLPITVAQPYALLIPTDQALSRYPDVVSFTSTKPRLLNIEYSGNANNPFKSVSLQFDPSTGYVGKEWRNESVSLEEICNRMGMVLRQHLIVLDRDEDRDKGLMSGNEYFRTADGGVVRIGFKDGKPATVQGTWQMANAEAGLEYFTKCNLTEGRTKGSSSIYTVDAPIEATQQSVYGLLSSNEQYKEFFDVLRSTDLIDYQTGGVDYNLSLVGNVPFTLFVPTNDAMQRAFAEGKAYPGDEVVVYDEATGNETVNEEKLATNTAFVRAHLMFGLEIADQLPFVREHNSMLVSSLTLTTPRLRVFSSGNGQMTVTDELGNTRNVLAQGKNRFVCQIYCTRNGRATSPTGLNTMNNLVVTGQAHGVVHLIDGVLDYEK